MSPWMKRTGGPSPIRSTDNMLPHSRTHPTISADEADHPGPLSQRRGVAPPAAFRAAARGSWASIGSSGWSWTTARPTRTVEVARRHGVDHLVRLTTNKGLATAFQAGLDAALKLGADVIVNTDADNQYRSQDIPRLVEPIMAGRADMVVGDRQVQSIDHFSPTKKLLQRLGSWVVRRASGTDVLDTTSGFRAYNREAALQLIVVSRYTYTLESLIQAGKMSVALEDVPISTEPHRQGVPPGGLDLLVRTPQRLRDLPRLHPVRAAAGVHDARAGLRGARARCLVALPNRLDPERRSQRTHPVADPRRGAAAGGGPDVRPRHHRRRARRPAGDRPARL